ncbi:hypothetical protein H6G35_03940 [Aulosira sp. FACHB-113]|nr:hypothetical protein [Aulosira sp. FACHB-113]
MLWTSQNLQISDRSHYSHQAEFSSQAMFGNFRPLDVQQQHLFPANSR